MLSKSVDFVPKMTKDNRFTYFSNRLLKKRLEFAIRWIAWHKKEDYSAELEEPPAGYCSNPETNEKVLTLPDSLMGYSWLYLAQIEYKFRHGMKALEHASQITDWEADPVLSFFLVILEVQYNFRNKTFDNLPQRIHQMANAGDLIRENNQSESVEEIGENAIHPTSIAHVPNFASVGNIIVMLVASLLVQLPVGRDTRESLAIWRANSSELPIKDNMAIALDLIESMLYEDKNNALTMMRTEELKAEKRLVAALKIVHDIETSPENLFEAHILIATSLIDQTWLDSVVTILAELLSVQWLEKIKSGALSQMNKITVGQIEQACNNSETGKKKIGKILLAAYPVVSLMVPSEVVQQFHSWSDNP